MGYKLKGAMPKLLSNLFSYEFKFSGIKWNCIENVFQGIKFKDKKEQNLVFNYKGLDACNIKESSLNDWKDNHIIYWQGKSIDRFSKEYDDFLDELYISAIQNPLYINMIKKCNKYIYYIQWWSLIRKKQYLLDMSLKECLIL